MTHWLGAVSRDHVRRGVALGIAQIGHGKRAGLARMQPGDWLVHYSPRTSLGRRGLLELSEHDFTVIRGAMIAT